MNLKGTDLESFVSFTIQNMDVAMDALRHNLPALDEWREHLARVADELTALSAKQEEISFW